HGHRRDRGVALAAQRDPAPRHRAAGGAMKRLQAPALLVLAACGQQLNAPPLAHLDRPNDISFGCAANQTQADNAIITVALPASACAGIAVAPDAGTAPLPDAGALTAAFPLAFVIEATRGDLSVGNLSGTGSFVDSDVFAPGLNGIPVGR